MLKPSAPARAEFGPPRLALCVLLLGAAATARAADSLLVYELAGTVQCSDQPGHSPAAAAKALRALGLPVLSAERRRLPRPMPERCNAPTGDVNVFRVPAADWRRFVASGLATEEYLPWTFGDDRIEVYRHDGSRQCEPGSGTAPADMAEALRSAGVEVHGSRSGHDGLNRAAVCGAPTGNIDIFSIDASDLEAARELGFRPRP